MTPFGVITHDVRSIFLQKDFRNMYPAADAGVRASKLPLASSSKTCFHGFVQFLRLALSRHLLLDLFKR